MITLTYSSWFHHKHSAMSSAILNLDVEKLAVAPFNSATTSFIASRIVPLNVDKNGGMICGGFRKKSVSFNTYGSDSSSCILNGLLSSCFDKCWYLWWRKRDSKGHSLWTSGRSNETDDTKLDISRSKNQRECKHCIEWHVCSSYFMFSFYFTPENLSWGKLYVESSSATFYR